MSTTFPFCLRETKREEGFCHKDSKIILFLCLYERVTQKMKMKTEKEEDRQRNGIDETKVRRKKVRGKERVK